MTDKTLQERLRGYNPPDRTIDEQRQISVDIHDAADALDAQEARIKALEGALRKVVEEWDNDYCVDYADVIEDTRALLTPDET